MNMIRLTVHDADDNHIETVLLPPDGAADRVREFVFLQGADPDHGGVGATGGSVRFEAVKVVNPSQDSKFLAPYQHNFEALLRACKNGDLTLMHGSWKRTGSPVPVVCAVEKLDGGTNFVPLGMLFCANPYELVVPAWGQEPVTDGEKLLAELHELEGRVHTIRQYLNVAHAAGGWPKDSMAVAPFTVLTTVEGGVLNHVAVRDATGAEVPFSHEATDLDEEDEDDEEDVECSYCGSSDTEYTHNVANGSIHRCRQCGEETLGPTYEDEEDEDDTTDIDPLSDVIEDQGVPDAPDDGDHDEQGYRPR